MNQPRFHVLAGSLTTGDAVSNDVLRMTEELRRQGFVADVFAQHIDGQLRDRVRLLHACEEYLDRPDDVMIYHHSIDWWEGVALWERTRNRRVLRYHNVTPGHFLDPYDPVTADACRVGTAETERLVASRPDLALPCSEYSAAELAGLADGPLPMAVVPPFHTMDDLDAAPVDRDLEERLRDGINLLFVGRVSPNKGHRRLLRVLARCTERLANVRLHVVGGMDGRLGGYYRLLGDEAAALGIAGRVHYTGKVTLAQLKTYYRAASAFLCLSEHEGFCVPLAEAMYFGVPVVAYRGCAIASTLGEAHPLLWEAPDPSLAAESVRRLVDQPPVRALVIDYQRRRYDACFSHAALRERFLTALRPVLPGRAAAAPGDLVGAA